uniref:Mitochondrial cytochrome c oxidase subunit 6b n=1 Tax=Chlamydomonas sp. ICE-L TaxID=309537 RepID=Q209Q4_9CHLO|nr:mitochondrial cytochrome c oxidase subunit 6b [Chlamydomonas sp. ICE-L]
MNWLFPVARADTGMEEAPAPPPPSSPTLASLSADELEELKNEVINEVVTKIAGEDGSKLENFLEGEMVSAPYDVRFPNKNQARHCFVRFNEYYKCIHERGEDHARCQFYQSAYQSLCPSDWLENWTELREQGLWIRKY